MSEKPIIFSGPMVRAILDGTKTQDRRVLKNVSCEADGRIRIGRQYNAGVYEDDRFRRFGHLSAYFPYAPGDRLWVRETWCSTANRPDEVSYRATAIADGWEPEEEAEQPWRPSIHMPRWASRINLLVTAVRVERLREISEADAIAEGCRPFFDHANLVMEPSPNDGSVPMAPLKGPLDAFAHLWDSINAKRPGCSWTDSPWVAAISFEVMR